VRRNRYTAGRAGGSCIAWEPLKWIVHQVPRACAAGPGAATVGLVGVHGMLELGRCSIVGPRLDKLWCLSGGVNGF
jgi:hypothetical protein